MTTGEETTKGDEGDKVIPPVPEGDEDALKTKDEENPPEPEVEPESREEETPPEMKEEEIPPETKEEEIPPKPQEEEEQIPPKPKEEETTPKPQEEEIPLEPKEEEQEEHPPPPPPPPPARKFSFPDPTSPGDAVTTSRAFLIKSIDDYNEMENRVSAYSDWEVQVVTDICTELEHYHKAEQWIETAQEFFGRVARGEVPIGQAIETLGSPPPASKCRRLVQRDLAQLFSARMGPSPEEIEEEVEEAEKEALKEELEEAKVEAKSLKNMNEYLRNEGRLKEDHIERLRRRLQITEVLKDELEEELEETLADPSQLQKRNQDLKAEASTFEQKLDLCTFDLRESKRDNLKMRFITSAFENTLKVERKRWNERITNLILQVNKYRRYWNEEKDKDRTIKADMEELKDTIWKNDHEQKIILEQKDEEVRRIVQAKCELEAQFVLRRDEHLKVWQDYQNLLAGNPAQMEDFRRQEKIETLESDLILMTEQKEQMQLTIELLGGSNEELASKVDRVVPDLDAKKNEVEATKKELERCLQEVRILRKRPTNWILLSERDAARKDVERLTKELEESQGRPLSGAYDSLMAEKDATIIRLESDIKALKLTRTASEENEISIAAKDAEIKSLEEDIEILKTANDGNVALCNSKDAEMIKLQKDIELLKTANDGNVALCNTKDADIKHLQKDIIAFNTTNKEYVAAFTRKDADIKSLQEEIVSLNREKLAKDAEIKRQKEEIHRSNAEIKDLKRGRSNYQKKVQKLEESAKTSKAELSESEATLNKKRDAELETILAETETVRSEHEETDRKNQELISDYREKTPLLQEQVKSLTERLSNKEKMIQRMRDTPETPGHELRILSEANDKLIVRVQTLENNLDREVLKGLELRELNKGLVESLALAKDVETDALAKYRVANENNKNLYSISEENYKKLKLADEDKKNHDDIEKSNINLEKNNIALTSQVRDFREQLDRTYEKNKDRCPKPKGHGTKSSLEKAVDDTAKKNAELTEALKKCHAEKTELELEYRKSENTVDALDIAKQELTEFYRRADLENTRLHQLVDREYPTERTVGLLERRARIRFLETYNQAPPPVNHDMEKLLEKNAQLEVDIKSLQDSIIVEKNSGMILRSKVDQLEERNTFLENCVSPIATDEQKYKHLQQMIDNLQAENEELETERMESSAETQVLLNQVDDLLKTGNVSFHEELQARIKQLEEQNATLEKAKSDLSAQAWQLQNRLEMAEKPDVTDDGKSKDLQAQFDKLQAEKQVVEKDKSELAVLVKQLEVRIDELSAGENTIIAAKEELELVNEKIIEAQTQEIAALKDKIDEFKDLQATLGEVRAEGSAIEQAASAAHNRLQVLEYKSARLQRQNSTYRKTHLDQEKKVEALEAKVKELEEANKDLQTTVDDLRNNNEKLGKEIQQHQIKIKDLQAENSRFRAYKNLYDKEVKDRAETKDDCEKTKKMLQDRISELQLEPQSEPNLEERFRDLNVNIKEQGETIKKLEEKEKELQAANAELGKNKKMLESTIKDLHAEKMIYQQYKIEGEQVDRMLLRERFEHGVAVAGLQSVNDRIVANLKHVRLAYNKLRSVKVELENNKWELQERIEDLLEEFKELRDANAELEKDKSGHESTTMVLKAHKNRLESDITVLREMHKQVVEDLEAAKDKLKTANKDLRDRFKCLEEEKTTLQVEVNRIDGELLGKSREFENLESENGELAIVKKQLEETTGRLEKEKEELQSKLDSVGAQLLVQTQAANHLRLASDGGGKSKPLKDRLLCLQNEKEELEAKVATIEAQLLEKTQAVKDLEMAESELRKTNKELSLLGRLSTPSEVAKAVRRYIELTSLEVEGERGVNGLSSEEQEGLVKYLALVEGWENCVERQVRREMWAEREEVYKACGTGLYKELLERFEEVEREGVEEWLGVWTGLWRE